MFGLLNVNKPPGMTSREVVNNIDWLIQPAKSGHAGTLDPLATGVLVVCVGPATRLVEYVQRMPKRYLGTFLLGRSSPTDDVESEITPLENPPRPTLDELRGAAARMIGVIQQRPPAYSAVKVSGRRAYQLARAGKTVELAPRPVTILRCDLVRYEYPELVLDIECGSGTYVRSIGRDLAESLGTAAVMAGLVRTAIGGFRLEDAVSLDSLTAENIRHFLLPPLRAVEGLPIEKLDEDELQRLAQGQSICLAHPGEAELVAVDAVDNMRAILARRADGSFGPTKNFPPSVP